MATAEHTLPAICLHLQQQHEHCCMMPIPLLHTCSLPCTACSSDTKLPSSISLPPGVIPAIKKVLGV